MSKILIVEDSDIDRFMLTQVLKKKGHIVVGLPSGEKIFESIETEKPDLILLDVLMPGLKGNEILHAIRAKYSAVELPIIIVTSLNETSALVEFLYLGANDFIRKPVDVEVALVRIGTHIKLTELTRERVRLKELEAINAIVTTYNHEINNPLAIAMGSLSNLQEKFPEEKNLERIDRALWRIADIVKKILKASQDTNLNFQPYDGETKMVRIK